MFEQETKQLMDLDCIENVEQINDSTAESLNGGLKINLKINGEDNILESKYNSARLNIGYYTQGDTYEINVLNDTDRYSEYHVELRNADTGNFLEYTHGGRLRANPDQWTNSTIAHDEMKDHRGRMFLNVVKKV